MKEFEEKIRKQYELQEKLDAIHKKQGTGQYRNGSHDGSMIQIDLAKVSSNGNGNGVKEKVHEAA